MAQLRGTVTPFLTAGEEQLACFRVKRPVSDTPLAVLAQAGLVFYSVRLVVPPVGGTR